MAIANRNERRRCAPFRATTPVTDAVRAAFLSLFVVLLAGRVHAADRSELIVQIQRFVPHASLASEHLSHLVLAGRYSANSPEVAKRAGPALGGANLYLFADRSYLATEWGCLLPETIADRGEWTYRNGYVELESDHSVSKRDNLNERRFVVLEYRVGLDQGYRLMGLNDDLASFVAKAAAGDDFMLLLHSQSQIERFDQINEKLVKAKLIRTAWNPDFFK